jgi:hypothetical protein
LWWAYGATSGNVSHGDRYIINWGWSGRWGWRGYRRWSWLISWIELLFLESVRSTDEGATAGENLQ